MAETAEFLILQSAALPYRLGRNGLEVLLITASKSGRWIIPKGHIEPFTTPAGWAMEEAWEEAGVRGEIHHFSIGEWYYRKRRGLYRVRVFPMEVDSLATRWPERGKRHRRWFSLEKARRAVDEPDLYDLIAQLPEFLDCHSLESRAEVI